MNPGSVVRCIFNSAESPLMGTKKGRGWKEPVSEWVRRNVKPVPLYCQICVVPVCFTFLHHRQASKCYSLWQDR